LSGEAGESKKTRKAAYNKGFTYSLLAYPLKNAFIYVDHDLLLLSAAMNGEADGTNETVKPGNEEHEALQTVGQRAELLSSEAKIPRGQKRTNIALEDANTANGDGNESDISAVSVEQEAEEKTSTVRAKKQSLSQKKLLFNAVQEDAKTAIEESIKSLSAWLKDTGLRSNTTLDALGTFPHAIGKKTGTYSSEVQQLFCFCVGRPRKALNAEKCKVLGIRNVRTFEQIQNRAIYLVRDLKGPGVLNQVHAICESEIDAASSRFDVKINVITLSVYYTR
jgi:hypothetical protein